MDPKIVNLITYLTVQGIVAAFVWLIIQGASKVYGLSERSTALAAMGVGGALSCLCHWAGFVGIGGVSSLAEYVCAFIFGLLSALAAGGVSDHNLLSVFKGLKSNVP